MGLLDLFKKKNNNGRVEPEIIMEISSEDYAPIIQEIAPTFISFIRKLDSIEQRIYENRDSEKIKKECREAYGRVGSELCTEDFLQKRRYYLTSYGQPTRYALISNGCKLKFEMKSIKKMSITMYNENPRPGESAYMFILKNTNDGWKIDNLFCRFKTDDSWHIQNFF